MAPCGVLKSWGGWWSVFKCYYSGTWSWVKPLTIPESPSIDLYNTCLEFKVLAYYVRYAAYW